MQMQQRKRIVSVTDKNIESDIDETALNELLERWSLYVNVLNLCQQAQETLETIGDNKDIVNTLVEIRALLLEKVHVAGRLCDVEAERLGYEMDDDDDDENLSTRIPTIFPFSHNAGRVN